MKRKVGDRTNKLFLLIGSIMLGISGLLLIGLQYRWINQIADIEKERIQGEMRRSTIRALSAAGDEVRILISLFQSPFHPDTDQEAMESGELTEKITYWREHTPYPGLLKEFYILRRNGEENLLYRLNEGNFKNASPPEALALLVKTYREGWSMPELWEKIERKKRGEYIFIPTKKLNGTIIYHIDLSVLFRDILPAYMKEYLESYPFRIVSSNKRTIEEFTSGEDLKGEPEIILVIHNPLLLLGDQRKLITPDSPGHRLREDGPTEEDLKRDRGPSRSHPLVEFWFNRTLEDIGSETLEDMEEPLAFLEIYYPLGPIDQVVSSRKAANLFVGTGILIILLLSLFIMNRLYIRTKRLQLREREFVAGVSHELRTPIAVIHSSASNLARGLVTGPEKVRKYGATIEDQSKRLSRMVESILTLAGLSQRGSREESLFDPQELIHQVAAELDSAAAKNGVEIKTEIEDLPEKVMSYPRALRLILENLLINALYHGTSSEEETPQKESPFPVFVRSSLSERKNRYLLVHVEDRGKGIPPEEAEAVFEPFLRGKRAVENQLQGSGLGLHLIKKVLTEIGGSIELESPYEDRHGLPRTGCRFTVSLPFRLPEESGGEKNHG